MDVGNGDRCWSICALEQDSLFEAVKRPWIVDRTWTILSYPNAFARDAANESTDGSAHASFGFSRAWLAERAAFLKTVPESGRTWLLEVSLGMYALTSIQRQPLHADGVERFEVRYLPVVALPSSAADELNVAHLCAHAHFGPFAILTRRELDIFRLLGAGKSNVEIAKHIHRTPRLVESVALRLRRRLGNDTLRGIVIRSARTGFADIHETHWEALVANHTVSRVT